MMMMPCVHMEKSKGEMCVCVPVCVFMHVIGVDEMDIEDSVSKPHDKFVISLNPFSGVVIDG